MTDHDALRDAAGPWVLGALDEDEAYGFAAHLEVCASCREEVTRLRIAADALPLAAPPVAPPPELKSRLMAIVEAEAAGAASPKPARTPWRERLGALFARPAFAAAAAALLLVVGAVAGFAVRGGDGSSPRVVAMSVDRTTARGAKAQLVQSDQGVQVRVSDMPAPRRGASTRCGCSARATRRPPTPSSPSTATAAARWPCSARRRGATRCSSPTSRWAAPPSPRASPCCAAGSLELSARSRC